MSYSNTLENTGNEITGHFSSSDEVKKTKTKFSSIKYNDIQIYFQDTLKKLCFIHSSNNNIILDCRYFTFIASPENYDLLIEYITSIIKNVLEKNYLFSFHVNLQSLKLIHIEKHYSFITKISQTLKDTFPDKLDTCYIYNAPFIFSNIFNIISVFIDKKTQQKIKLVKE